MSGQAAIAAFGFLPGLFRQITSLWAGGPLVAFASADAAKSRSSTQLLDGAFSRLFVGHPAFRFFSGAPRPTSVPSCTCGSALLFPTAMSSFTTATLPPPQEGLSSNASPSL